MIIEFLELLIGIPIGIILWKIVFSGINIDYRENLKK